MSKGVRGRRATMFAMPLLEFARGPGLAFAFVVFLAGMAIRLRATLRRGAPDLSVPRSNATLAGAWQAIWRRMLPRHAYGAPGRAATLNALAWHLGLLVVVLAFAPHIGFVQRLTGLAWPALPDVVTYLATALTLGGLLIALVLRWTDPVLRLLSNFDDWFSWFVTTLPLLTGMALIERVYVPAPPWAPAHTPDPVLLAVHLLSLELLLVWFPFGKLAHAVLAFVSRARTGAAFARKGAAQ